jgi:hypothetical protein
MGYNETFVIRYEMHREYAYVIYSKVTPKQRQPVYSFILYYLRLESTGLALTAVGAAMLRQYNCSFLSLLKVV